MTAADPTLDLWLDWCAVTGNPPGHRDEGVLGTFARQTDAPRRLLESLRPRLLRDGPAWPMRHRDDRGSLVTLTQHAGRLIDHPNTDWVTRLRLRRLCFAGVLLAPSSHGGLGLSRGQARRLGPKGLLRRRHLVLTDPDATQCPACAVSIWLEVVGTATSWTQASIRALGHQRGHREPDGHLCTLPDSSTDWLASPALLPAIDRWGYIDPWISLHPSSTSTLIPVIDALLAEPAPAVPLTPDPRPRPVIDPISAEEEAAVFARADELLARMRVIFDELD